MTKQLGKWVTLTWLIFTLGHIFYIHIALASYLVLSIVPCIQVAMDSIQYSDEQPEVDAATCNEV